MTPKPLSVSVMPLENRRETLMYLGQAADRLGYTGYLLPETWSYDMFVLPSAGVGLKPRRSTKRSPATSLAK